MVRARDAVGAQQRHPVGLKSHHHELPILEAQAVLARRRDGKLGTRVVPNSDDAFRADGRHGPNFASPLGIFIETNERTISLLFVTKFNIEIPI